MLNDITNKKDIEILVNAFYDKVMTNKIIGHIFNDIVKVNWDHHLPRMYAFWTNMLLQEGGFSGNPMLTHISISKLTTMSETEFSEWLRLFHETVDELFKGDKANEAKMRADNIARLMLAKIKIHGQSSLLFKPNN